MKNNRTILTCAVCVIVFLRLATFLSLALATDPVCASLDTLITHTQHSITSIAIVRSECHLTVTTRNGQCPSISINTSTMW